MTITIIGAGAMGMAIAYGLKDRYKLEFVEPDISRQEELKKEFDADIYSPDDFDITDRNIILVVKPYILESVGRQIKGKANTLYSVLAGSTIEALKANIDAKNYIRIMPNVSAKFGASTSVITGDKSKREEAEEIFSAIGDTFWVDSEKEIDIATAIAGSGPALLTLVAEAMMDGLVKEGMKRPDAIGITNSLFKGFAPLISSAHPAVIKDAVMSPGGTTAAAYAMLEEGAVRSSFIKAVEEAFKVTQK
ncbi:pyrroline-5-carboxylate reductase [Sulfurovum sp. bin170]|uniref:pyrroline-5-carboxylate reductase n=1 Tax=Sulfurovum sp. bin170 TaxID=2695268 RepID=UPI002103C99E|nr:pyrroline-5-carboxylate reductase [Sulfurovum sp. bin170]